MSRITNKPRKLSEWTVIIKEELFMKAIRCDSQWHRWLFTFAVLCMLTSCGTTVARFPDGRTIVQAGFLSKIKGLAVVVESPDGTKIKVIQKEYNGTEVAETGIIAWGMAKTAIEATKATISNNGVKTTQITSEAATVQQKNNLLYTPTRLAEGERVFTPFNGIPK